MKEIFYKGFTLIELLVSISIMIIIILVLSLTFSTLIKSSIISNSIITVRDESDFALKVFENIVKQSNTSSIVLFKTDHLRSYSLEKSEIVNNVDDVSIEGGYSSSAFLPVNSYGNEIHILPNGGERWLCFGYFKDVQTGKGVLLKTSSSLISGVNNHSACFNSDRQEYKKNTIQLNTSATDIKDFKVSYFYADNENSVVLAEILSEPDIWFGSSEKIEIVRQVLVSTRKLTSIY